MTKWHWLLLSFMVTFCSGYYLKHYQITTETKASEGVAKQWLIREFQGIEVPPEIAKHVNITITTTDVQLSIDQFTVIGDQ